MPPGREESVLSNETRSRVRKSERPDRRVVRSRQALGRALVELMVARNFDDISVQQVLERARVGRATFYAHFRNKNDLLLSDTERFCELLLSHFETHAAGTRRIAPVAELFAHAREYRAFQSALERSGLREPVYDLVAGHLARSIGRRIRSIDPGADRGAIPLGVVSRMLAAAVVEMMRWWLDRNGEPSVRDMDARFHEIAWQGLGRCTPDSASGV